MKRLYIQYHSPFGEVDAFELINDAATQVVYTAGPRYTRGTEKTVTIRSFTLHTFLECFDYKVQLLSNVRARLHASYSAEYRTQQLHP